METTTRWLSMLGIGTLCFGISLFVLRIPIRTIIVFFIIGVPLVALWLYVDARSKQQKKISSETTTATQVCICSICKHDEAQACFQENCACCLLTKGNTVVGHSVNPLQQNLVYWICTRMLSFILQEDRRRPRTLQTSDNKSSGTITFTNGTAPHWRLSKQVLY